MKIIMAHATKCHKSSSFISITSSLSSIKHSFILIGQYLIDHTEKNLNDTNVILSILLDNPEMTSSILDFCSYFHIWK